MMNIFKLFCLALTLWLVGCASTIQQTAERERASNQNTPTSTPSTPVSVFDAKLMPPAERYSRQRHGSDSDSDRLSLITSRDLRLATPPPANDPYALMPILPRETLARPVASLSPPVDLWDRIRRGYAMPDLRSDLVRDREQWYATRPDYIYRMTERSKKYLFHVVEELELRNMPTELALLPFIESAFNPQAVSSAKAAGMWQFMPATGKYFELKQNAFRDDRRDVLASTRAALDYLQKLYRMFGDWHLALAAYNWGEGSVARAVAKNKRTGQSTAYTDLNMPMETRFYVPKLQAVKNIVSNPDSFGSKLPLIENHPYFQSVTIRRDIDVALAAKLAEVPLDDFKALNPSINRPVIMAAGTPQILLPWDNAEIYQSNLDGYGGSRLASWTVWVAPTTMHPAEAARRVGMAEAELRSVNNIPSKVVIRAGSTLLVPRASHMAQDVTAKVADSGQVSLAPEIVLKRVLVRAGRRENVANIARKYKVSTASVAQWNKVGVSATFKPGQQLVLFLPASSLGSTKTETDKPSDHKVEAKTAKTPPPARSVQAHAAKKVPAKRTQTAKARDSKASSAKTRAAKARPTKLVKR